MTSISIEGGPLRRWLESAPADRRQALVGYHLDDGKDEWLIDAVAEHALILILLDADGETPTKRRKQLPVSSIEDSHVIWGEDADLYMEILNSRSSLQVQIDEALRIVLEWGWPASVPLGPTAIDLANILIKCGVDGGDLKEEDIDRFAEIVERAKAAALFGANWLRRYIENHCSAALSLGGHCRIHASALFRLADRFEDALSITEMLATGQTTGLSQSAIATMCVTRAAALMDKFEASQWKDNSTTLLTDARTLLNRSYAIHGGAGEYHQNSFFRLLSLEKSLRRNA